MLIWLPNHHEASSAAVGGEITRKPSVTGLSGDGRALTGPPTLWVRIALRGNDIALPATRYASTLLPAMRGSQGTAVQLLAKVGSPVTRSD